MSVQSFAIYFLSFWEAQQNTITETDRMKQILLVTCAGIFGEI